MKRRGLTLLAACAVALAAPAAQAGGIYKCKTVGGRTVISDKPCTQESLGKEGLKLATPPPEAAKPPERSGDYATGHSGKARTAPAEVAAPAPGQTRESATRSAQDKSRERQEAAEKQSEEN